MAMIRYQSNRLALDIALKGWSKTHLARVAGVSPMTVTRACAGVPPVKPSTWAMLAHALGYPVSRYITLRRG